MRIRIFTMVHYHNLLQLAQVTAHFHSRLKQVTTHLYSEQQATIGLLFDNDSFRQQTVLGKFSVIKF